VYSRVKIQVLNFLLTIQPIACALDDISRVAELPPVVPMPQQSWELPPKKSKNIVRSGSSSGGVERTSSDLKR
jgi:hypothetical protein